MRTDVRKIVTGAVLTALVFIVTWSVRIPIPATNGGYVNLGDIIIYIAAYTVGGPAAICGAAIGSALSDLLAGATVYIIPTFIIKGLMALAALALLQKGKKTAVRYMLACLFGGAIMTAGYGLFEYAFFGFTYAVGSLPSNLLQWAGGTIIAFILYPAVKRLEPLIKQ